jgi:hypothetical protein
VETVADEPLFPNPKRAMPLPEAANDNSTARKLRARVLISGQLPITQTEIEVFALLLDDLASLVANDNEDECK